MCSRSLGATGRTSRFFAVSGRPNVHAFVDRHVIVFVCGPPHGRLKGPVGQIDGLGKPGLCSGVDDQVRAAGARPGLVQFQLAVVLEGSGLGARNAENFDAGILVDQPGNLS